MLSLSPSSLWLRLRGWQPHWRLETLALVASLYFTAFCNGNWWRGALAGRSWSEAGTWGFALAVFAMLAALQFALLALLLVSRHVAKPLLALLLVVTAFAVYYMGKYNVYLDPTMLRNVLRTDVHEARELIGWGLLPALLLHAALPVALLWRVRLRRVPPLRALLQRLLAVVAALALGVGALLLVFQDFSSLMRNQKELRYLITPANYLYSLAWELGAESQTAARPRQPLGTDARLSPRWAARERPTLVVLVVGETARAANWGLDGYARQTTPELAAVPELINFPHVTSCGTNTEVSVPCMFSPGGRRRYDESRIRGSETLLHVLKRAGVDVSWHDNQSGCKGVCDGIVEMTMSSADDPALCDGERCLDEILLHSVAERLRSARGPQLLVLHMLGNHGPAYYKRYPPAFRRFVPPCDSADLRTCSREEIVNAYDNALLYTDHVLAQAIAQLKAHADAVDSLLLYVSDHGESLGERNLYLHGLPYAIAPSEQTQVPMVMWVSPGYAQDFGLDLGCLRRRAAQPAQHDHLFHTVLGLLEVQTGVYEREMDLAAGCRR